MPIPSVDFESIERGTRAPQAAEQNNKRHCRCGLRVAERASTRRTGLRIGIMAARAMRVGQTQSPGQAVRFDRPAHMGEGGRQ